MSSSQHSHHGQASKQNASGRCNRDGDQGFGLDGLLKTRSQGLVQLMQLGIELFLEWIDRLHDLHTHGAQAGGLI